MSGFFVQWQIFFRGGDNYFSRQIFLKLPIEQKLNCLDLKFKNSSAYIKQYFPDLLSFSVFLLLNESARNPLNIELWKVIWSPLGNV